MSTTITVSNAAELNQALSQATGGETILLAAGDYGDLYLRNTQFASNVTIQSADANAPASFSAVNLNQTSNITFDSILFDYTASSGDPEYLNSFGVYSSSNITFNNSVFDGDISSGTGSGTGLIFRDSSNVEVNNSEFKHWWKAVITANTDGIDIVGNDIHSIRSDGLVFDNVDNILVEQNYIHDFGALAGSGDHRDMLQIQRANGSGSDNIIIRDNIFDMGQGDFAQTIFAGGDGKNTSDPNVIHHNVLIEGNVIYNGHLHGISLFGVDGLTVRKNSVLHVDEKTLTGSVEVPVINISSDSSNVTIEQNITANILGHNGQSDWNVNNNALIQPGDYDQHFNYRATAQADGYNQFLVKPGSAADSLNAGSDLVSNISGSYLNWLSNTGSSGSNNPSQPDTGGQQPDTGGQQPDTGGQQPDTGGQQPDTGEQQPDTGGQQPDTGEQQPDDGEQQPDTGGQQPDTGGQQPDTGGQQPDTGEQQPDTGGQQPDTGEQQPDDGEQQPDTGEQQPDTGEQQPDTGEQQPDDGEDQPDTGEEEQEPVAALPGNLIDISEQDGRGRIGLLEEYQNSGQICFSVEVARDEGDTGAERLAWNPSNFGLKVNRKGDLVAKVDNNDGGFRDGFKIKDIGLNDGEAHQVTLMVDQESDRLQVSVDGVLVLDETETDFDFVGGREKGWFLGDSVDAFAIEDAVQFVDGSLDQYYDLFA